METILREQNYTAEELIEFKMVFEKLGSYLHKDETFLSPNLNRTTLSSALKVNEKTLCRSVGVCSSGETLGQYIEKLRMTHARKLLQRYHNYSIDAIISECGFSSRSTFYRLFFKHYGCSPNSFRRSERMQASAGEIDS